MPVLPKNRAKFERYAAPEAVQFQLDDARRRLASVQTEVAWMTELLAKRTAEKAAGTWPYTDEVS